MYFKECPDCGAHLDPGERCDCKEAKREDAPDAAGTPSEINSTVSVCRMESIRAEVHHQRPHQCVPDLATAASGKVPHQRLLRV